MTWEGSDPTKRRKKRFVANWRKDFPWLAYSKLYDGAFCIPCVFFANPVGHNSDKSSLLHESDLTGWTSANGKLKDHNNKSEMHKDAVVAMESFRTIKRGEAVAINDLLSRARSERIQKNRAKLLPIIKTVAFCGRQNIALRGHRDDDTNVETSWNKGNFRELLDFRVDSGDTVLKEHLQTAPKNATYKSKNIQKLFRTKLSILLVDI